MASSVDSYIWLLAILGGGAGFAAVATVIVLFGYSITESARYTGKLIALAAITSLSAAGLGAAMMRQAPQTSARQEVSAHDVRIDDVGEYTIITFRTEAPAYVYLEYHRADGLVVPILAPNASASSVAHEFTTKTAFTGGYLLIYVNGQPLRHDL